MGPKILTLLPVWLLGAQAYRRSNCIAFRPMAGWSLSLAPLLIYVGYRGFEMNAILDESTEATVGRAFMQNYLGYSQAVVNDYIVRCLVAVHFIRAAAISRTSRFAAILVRQERPVSFLASYTFSIYLLHFPLLLFFAAITHNDPKNPAHQFAILAATILTILLVGTYTERRKKQLKSLLRAWSRRLYFAKR